jgi:GT2 family glycosyltransferase
VSGLPPISVAISTRDRAELLARCLGALAAGSVLPAEVVIADQSADDATRELAGRFDALEVRYLHVAAGGLGAAQNAAIEAAGSELVAVLDDDCVPDPQWLETVVRTFEAHPELGLVTGRVLPLPEREAGTVAVSSRTSPDVAEFDGRVIPWHVGSGNNFALRRPAFAAIGGNDIGLGPGAPGRGGVDMDLFYRLLRSGARGRYEPAALVLHERATPAGRLARRVPYGWGMGACVVKWLREGDRYAWRVLAAWLRLRGTMLARALGHRRWLAAYEELLVLTGTVRGIAYGVRAYPRRGRVGR